MKAITLLSIALGLAAGCIYGDERRRRKYAEGYAFDLEQLMEKYVTKTPLRQPALKSWPAS